VLSVLLGEPFETLASGVDEHGIRHVRIADLDSEPIPEPVERAETDTVLLRLTSGSTAAPKAVRITHGNLISNIRGLAARTNADPSVDVMVSWLPLFHDMGLVGNLTVAMTEGIELVKLTPADFLTNPLVWPAMITKYRGTFTSAPNFAYAITQRRLSKVLDNRRPNAHAGRASSGPGPRAGFAGCPVLIANWFRVDSPSHWTPLCRPVTPLPRLGYTCAI
jgi:fatty-acyl-CoA synthase